MVLKKTLKEKIVNTLELYPTSEDEGSLSCTLYFLYRQMKGKKHYF